ncbi:hypothetical protein [Piscibacillus salipiscarius]|uniref:hypothetical protein n=1 Tax=Piscibacillus salipiscarius TaxID=299480 RepID=UPI0006CF8F0F|nr:hypothetical protein [Piscibacillus salipiscarius]
MKDRHQFHRLYKLSLIIVLIIGVLVPYFSEQPAMASEENSGDSGFLIHSEKVEGEMNLLGAALGKIDIRSGTIEGLTIVSKLGTPSGPMTTQITSEGPVPVKNLKATTAGHSFPEIGGFCGVDVLSVFNNGNLEQVLKNTSLNQIKSASETMGYDLIKLLSQANGPDIDYEEFFNTTGDLPLTESLELLTELLREKGYEPNVDLSNPFTKQEIAELMDVLGVNVGLNQILNAVQPEPILPYWMVLIWDRYMSMFV